MSPKADAPLVQTSGQELKLVYPQDENRPEQFAHLDFEHFFLQPKDDPFGDPEVKATHTQAAFDYCLAHPEWRLSVQSHKYIGIP